MLIDLLLQSISRALNVGYHILILFFIRFLHIKRLIHLIIQARLRPRLTLLRHYFVILLVLLLLIGRRSVIARTPIQSLFQIQLHLVAGSALFIVLLLSE